MCIYHLHYQVSRRKKSSISYPYIYPTFLYSLSPLIVPNSVRSETTLSNSTLERFFTHASSLYLLSLSDPVTSLGTGSTISLLSLVSTPYPPCSNHPAVVILLKALHACSGLTTFSLYSPSLSGYTSRLGVSGYVFPTYPDPHSHLQTTLHLNPSKLTALLNMSSDHISQHCSF